MVTVAITGHRPEQLKDINWVRSALTKVLKNEQPEMLIQGMAAGVDLLSAQIAYDLNIPFIAAKPWAGHTPRVADKDLYEWVTTTAYKVENVDVSNHYPGVWVYHNRNKYMVDKADLVIAVWNGSTEGGTAACVKYAKQKNKSIIQINPETQEILYPEPSLF